MKNSDAGVIKKIFMFVGSKWEFLCLLCGALFYLAYVLYMHIEAPIETYMSKLYLVEPFYTGNLTPELLLIPYSGQGMLAVNLYFLFNLKMFHFSILAESLMNAILVFAVGWISLIYYTKKINREYNKKSFYYYIATLIMTMFLFTNMQQGGGGMSLQVRFGLVAFIVCTVMIDRCFFDKADNNRYFVMTLIAIFLSFCLFGTLYSYAGVPAVFLVILIITIQKKKFSAKSAIMCAVYMLSGYLYLIEYGLIAQGAGGSIASSGLMDKIINIFINVKRVAKAFLHWTGSVLLGRISLEEGYVTPRTYMLIGAIVFLLIIVSVFLFFKVKMYETTFLPIFWYGYYFALFAILYLGRGEFFDSGWFTSSWYTVHSKIVAVAFFSILIYTLNRYSLKRRVLMTAACICSIFWCVGLVFGSAVNIKRLPYEKIWILNKMSYFYVNSIDELPVDEGGMTPLLQDLQTTWDSICILKKYHLSLFRNTDTAETINTDGELNTST